MPKVFISWSGEASHKVAKALYEWLPVVLQSVKPFISSEDLPKGGRWVADLSGELEKDSFGILCLTPSNLVAPWVLFEAGALSKSVGDGQVAPFLVGVKPSELPSPLTQFNAVNANKEDFKKLVRAINESAPTELVAADRIDRAIDACWSKIEAELENAAEPPAPAVEKGAKHDGGSLERFDAILQELLTLNRGQSSLLSSPEKLLPRDYLDFAMRSRRDELPGPSHGVWDDLAERAAEIRLLLRHEASMVPSEVVEALLGPVEYLLRRIGRPPRFSGSRRLRAPDEDRAVDVLSPEDKQS